MLTNPIFCVVVKVKVLGYSLHPVILLYRLHILPKIIGPIHPWLHLNSPGSIQPGCSLAHRADQLTMPSLSSLYIFLLWRASGNWLAQGPDYDRFSQDSNLWSSDHWYGALTNCATVATTCLSTSPIQILNCPSLFIVPVEIGPLVDGRLVLEPVLALDGGGGNSFHFLKNPLKWNAPSNEMPWGDFTIECTRGFLNSKVLPKCHQNPLLPNVTI